MIRFVGMNQGNVRITGGSINGVPVGDLQPAAMNATTVNANILNATAGFTINGQSGLNATITIPLVTTLVVAGGLII